MTRLWPFKGCPEPVSREDHARLWLRMQDVKDDRERLDTDLRALREAAVGAYQYIRHHEGCLVWPSEGRPCDCGASEARRRLREALPAMSPVTASHEDAK